MNFYWRYLLFFHLSHIYRNLHVHNRLNCHEAEPHDWNWKWNPQKEDSCVCDKLTEGEPSYPYPYSISPDLKNCSRTSKALILTLASSAFVLGCFKEMHLLTQKKRLPWPTEKLSTNTCAAKNGKETHHFRGKFRGRWENVWRVRWPQPHVFWEYFWHWVYLFSKKSQVALLQQNW